MPASGAKVTGWVGDAVNKGEKNHDTYRRFGK
jgi:hypothetical protein